MEVDEVSTTTGAFATDLDRDETIALMQAQIDVQKEKIGQLVSITEQLKTQVQELQQWKESMMSSKASQVENTTASASGLEWGAGQSIVDLVKETAEQEVAKQELSTAITSAGFRYDEESAWYCDTKSGFYFEPNTSLTYSMHDKKYYEYDTDRGEYKLYPSEAAEKKLTDCAAVHWHPHQRTRKRLQKQKQKTEDPPTASNAKRKKENEKDTSLPKKIKQEEPEVVEVEDGELSSSSGSPDTAEDRASVSSGSTGTLDEEDEREEPGPAPCIRAIVLSSSAPDLRQGALFIITCMGGTIGREGTEHAVLIGDPNMSKMHLTVTYDDAPDPETGKIRKFYCVEDCGSKNGTWLNGERVSESKCTIVHGSTLKMGDTTLLLHIHQGTETCGHCEPGLLLQHEPMYPVEPGVPLTREQKDALRRKEQRKLRQKFGVSGDASGALSKLPDSYKDRAEERRVTKGSDNPFEKTEVASLDEPIRETNKGYNLMKKMGWADGASLGQSGDGGIKEPIKFEVRSGRVGLGSQQQPVANIPSASGGSNNNSRKASRNAEMLATVKRRYEQIQENESD